MATATLPGVRCPSCEHMDDKVVDSRSNEDGQSIRRRRECLECGTRFTTFERIEESALVVLKSDGRTEPYDRTKLERGILAAAKGRPVDAEHAASIAQDVEALGRRRGEITSTLIGLRVLDRLRALDEVAYLRFASVYKGFNDPTDFEKELDLLAAPDLVIEPPVVG